jgi:G:T-mismatch repair DNA endonuclease (very short patch repair protein)
MSSKPKTTEWFINKSKSIYGNEFDYSKSIYTFSKNTIEITCRIHGIFKQRASEHFKGNGCPICNRRIDLKEFLEKARLIHGEKYDYSLITNIDGMKNYAVSIICPTHGIFNQKIVGHIAKKQGCKKCGKIKTVLSLRKTQEDFIKEAIKKHGGLYDYSKVVYISSVDKVEIVCQKHGSFWQTPSNHNNSGHEQGCPSCAGNIRRTNMDFIEEAKKIHNNLYDYSLVDYISSKEKIKINCQNHGVFLQLPDNHLKGKGCPKCAHRVSKPEKEWLDSLGIPEELRQKCLRMSSGKQYEVDAYDPTIGTVYEFYGDFWHGNPIKFKPDEVHALTKKTYGELYLKTLSKEKELKENGYTVLSIWESDFLNAHKFN